MEPIDSKNDIQIDYDHCFCVQAPHLHLWMIQLRLSIIEAKNYLQLSKSNNLILIAWMCTRELLFSKGKCVSDVTI